MSQLAWLIAIAGKEMTMQVTSVAWSSRIGVQHRIADRFRQGRLYLVGDAAHAFHRPPAMA